jgi:1,2-diacylglycerol 3-beta-glucosyltransferase
VNPFVFGAIDIAAFLLCATFLAYVLLIVISLLRHKRSAPGDPSRLDWHFFIPCLNEERVVEATVADLFKKFPTAHIWCIDDGSTDTTATVVARLAQRSARIHVVTRRWPEAQEGKGPALNAAWRALTDWLPRDCDLSAVIVGVIDADGILDPLCARVIAGPAFFGNPRVGAVQIQVRVVNDATIKTSKRAQLLTRMQDLEFTTIIAGMQMLRRHVGSTSMGGNGQFTRMSALQKVGDAYGTPWEKALLEDFELGLRILLTGGETEYCHDTWVAQQGLLTIRQLIRQRSRWAQGLMQCFRYFWPVMRSPRISTPAALEIAYFLLLPWTQIVGIAVYTASLVILAYYALTTIGGLGQWFSNGAWGLIPLFLLFGIGPLVIWGPIYRRTIARDISLRHAALLGFLNWPYIYIHHASTIWAVSRMARSRHDWMKTERLDLPKRRPITAVTIPASAKLPVPTGRRPSPPRTLPPPRPKMARARVTTPPRPAASPPAPAAAAAAAAAAGTQNPAPAPASAPALVTSAARAAPESLVAVGHLRVSAVTRSPKARRALVVGGRLKPAAAAAITTTTTTTAASGAGAAPAAAPPALAAAAPGGGDPPTI